MPRRRVWTREEADLLVALFVRRAGRVSQADLADLRERLLALAPEYRDDPSYRSIGSIRSHLATVRLLAEVRPEARRVPRALREAWARQGRDIPFVLDREILDQGAAADRRELIRVMRRLRATLDELVSSPDYLPTAIRSSYAAAWMDLEDRGHIDQAIIALRGPAVDDLLAAHGLTGPQRTAKTESVEEAVRERRRRGGRGPLKALLGYLDSILGSLTGVFPWLGAVKEFKDITEASAELAPHVMRWSDAATERPRA